MNESPDPAPSSISRRRTWPLGLGLGILVLLPLRLIALDSLPAFIDETVHLQWAWSLAGAANGEEWSVQLGEIFGPHGRWLQPVVGSWLVPWTLEDLGALRALSVLFGLAGWLAVVTAARQRGGGGAAALAGILYGLCPFVWFHDRLAMSDAALAAASAVALSLTLRLASDPSWAWWRTAGLGLVLGLVLAAKLTGALAVIQLPVVLLVARAPLDRWLHGAVAVAVSSLSVLPLAVAFAVDSAQGPKLAASPFDDGRIVTNLLACGRWLGEYWTWPLFVAVGAATVWALAGRRRLEIALAVAALLPVAAFSFLATPAGLFPRYLLPATAPAVMLSALAIARATSFLAGRWRPLARGVAAVVLAVPMVRFDAAILWHPERAPLPARDRALYITSVSSGYAIAPVVERLAAELESCPAGLRVYVSETFSHRLLEARWRLRGVPDGRIESRCCPQTAEHWHRLLAESAGDRCQYLVSVVAASPWARGFEGRLAR